MALNRHAPTRLADAMVLIAESFLATGPAVQPAADRWTVQVNVDIADLVPVEPTTPGAQDGRPDRVHLADGQWVPRHVAERLLCDATMVAVLTDRGADDPSGVPDPADPDRLNPDRLNPDRVNPDLDAHLGPLPRSSVTARGKALRDTMAGRRVAASGGSGVLDVGRRTRAFSASLRRALVIRDQGCRFPGCINRLWVDGHHVIPLAQGGLTALDWVVLLCRRHHVLVHQGLEAGGGFRIVVPAPGRFVFLDPRGEVIEPAPTPPAASADQLPRSAPAGTVLTPNTITSKWAGERCDYSTAVAALLPQPAVGTMAS